MLTTEGPDESPQGIPLLLATELQDHLMTASNDLERLQRLLSDTCDSLMQGFHGVAGLLGQSLDDGEREADLGTQHLPRLREAMRLLYTAVTALQFQDMASQLITHTNTRLRSCADQLARDALYDDADGEAVVETAPLRPNPVTQDEMDAGSVELF
ncbi:MAG: hypothetical protein HZB72_01265 [Burkholderiales bacterium]|nr:hypothetical protein [Burkholderiales bacterium]MCH2241746.1 hypothetical protein [Aquabacterium sp.]